MTVAFKELFRLWWMQKRRAFHWKDVFIAAYFAVLFITMVVAFYAAVSTELQDKKLPFELVALVPLLAVCIVPGDLLLKLFWRRSPVEMDDYLRSRPVTPHDWALLVLIDTKMSFMQWMLPLCVAFVAALFIGIGWGILTLLVAFTCTLTNALVQNCWRRAPGNEYTLPLAFGYLPWLFVLYALGGLTFVALGLAEDDPSQPMRPHMVEWGTLVMSLVIILLNSLLCFVLHSYFARMKNHNEELHSPVTTTAHSLGEVSMWSIEWVQLLRSKRLRVSYIAMLVIFIFNVYTQQLTADTMQQDLGLKVNPMLLFAVGFPSLILAQWVLGIEANFFSGIWTKPWPVEGILRRKYYFFCALCGLATLLLIPAVLWMDLSPLALLSALLFSCGLFILPFMATCLFSSRMDLFASAFFNYQGGNKQLNIFSFIMFIPMALYFAAYWFLPVLWAHALVSALGLLGFALHTVYIHWIAGLWHKRRYEIMERWLSE
ncbi:MAG: hypothetical protein IJQ59_09760 [Bacteroidaceae bacterium]|nr:hypothetical protein [Bacteroidaceae bacterium]